MFMTTGEQNKPYFVVYEGVGDGMGNYSGIRTIIGYENIDDFLRSRIGTKDSDMVIARGVGIEDALELVKETSLHDYINAAIGESRIDGEINYKLLEIKFADIAFILREGLLR